MLEHTERCVAVSEPMSLIIVATKYGKFGDSPEIRQLARDIVRWECRPYPTMQPQPLGYWIKTLPNAFFILPLLRQRHLLFLIHC